MPYKISVYAIAKNEEKFADRWAESMSEADEIVVLDTGSTDNTVKILSSYPNIRVYSEKIEPWRFDTARNHALALVSQDADICISTDIDEFFEPGWRSGIEKASTRAHSAYGTDILGIFCPTAVRERFSQPTNFMRGTTLNGVIRCMKS